MKRINKKANYPVNICLRGNCSNRNIKKEEGKERDKIKGGNAKVWSPIATNSFVYFVVTQTHSFAFNCLDVFVLPIFICSLLVFELWNVSIFSNNQQ